MMSCALISDPTLTTDSVAQVLELVNDWNSLSDDVILSSQLSTIQQKYTTKKEISTECASHYVHSNPMCSWTGLASCLYYKGEFTAVEKVKPFLPLRGKYQDISNRQVSCGHAHNTAECTYNIIAFTKRSYKSWPIKALPACPYSPAVMLVWTVYFMLVQFMFFYH